MPSFAFKAIVLLPAWRICNSVSGGTPSESRTLSLQQINPVGSPHSVRIVNLTINTAHSSVVKFHQRSTTALLKLRKSRLRLRQLRPRQLQRSNRITLGTRRHAALHRHKSHRQPQAAPA
jgi:hypothetical protein